jgi:hypothetical protein
MTVLEAPLPLLEDTLLWSMRAWVIGHCRNVNVAARIGEVFEHLRAPAAAGYLDGFMRALCQGATRTLEVNCVCNPDVSADESALLDVHALHQMGFGDEAHALLRCMTTREGAAAGCDRSARLTLALTAAGHSLPRAPAALRRHAFLHYATPGASASTHLH